MEAGGSCGLGVYIVGLSKVDVDPVQSGGGVLVGCAVVVVGVGGLVNFVKVVVAEDVVVPEVVVRGMDFVVVREAGGIDVFFDEIEVAEKVGDVVLVIVVLDVFELIGSDAMRVTAGVEVGVDDLDGFDGGMRGQRFERDDLNVAVDVGRISRGSMLVHRIEVKERGMDKQSRTGFEVSAVQAAVLWVVVVVDFELLSCSTERLVLVPK